MEYVTLANGVKMRRSLARAYRVSATRKLTELLDVQNELYNII